MNNLAYYDAYGRIAEVNTSNPNNYGCLELFDVDLDNLNNYFIQDGVLVFKPERPSAAHVFDYITKQWVDPRSLAEVRAAQWTAIKAARQAAIEAPIVTSFGNFDATPDAQKSITDAVLMLQTLAALGTPTTIDFTLYDNSTATLTTEQMVQVGLMLGAQTQAAYSRGRTLRDQINAAATIAEVESVTW